MKKIGLLLLLLLFGMLPAAAAPRTIVLRSSWQTVNIGDVAHAPGLIELTLRQFPEDRVVLWPLNIGNGVEAMLRQYYPKLEIVQGQLNTPEIDALLDSADLFLQGSCQSIMRGDIRYWRSRSKKPYGFCGITLDQVSEENRPFIDGAAFLFCRDTLTLKKLQTAKVKCPIVEFGPDTAFAMTKYEQGAQDEFMRRNGLENRRFLCVIPRLRYTPYHQIFPDRPLLPDALRKAAYSLEHRDRDLKPVIDLIKKFLAATDMKVVLCPEMSYEVELYQQHLYPKLTSAEQSRTVLYPEFWLADRANELYRHAHSLLSMEMHSPIMAMQYRTPSFYLQLPTESTKGEMLADLGLPDFRHFIPEKSAAEIWPDLERVIRDYPAAQKRVDAAMQIVRERQQFMMDTIRRTLEQNTSPCSAATLQKHLATWDPSRPRLFATARAMRELAAIRQTPDGKKMAAWIIRHADAILKLPPSERIFQGKTMLSTSRLVLARVNYCTMAWLLTRDPRYARRAIAEMMQAAAFTDWNPAISLDTAEMTLALAIGYDTLHAQLTPAERDTLRRAILEQGLKPLGARPLWWTSGQNNWTQVCHAAALAGALAIYEDDPPFAASIIAGAIAAMPKVMRHSVYPNGAYPEGPMYWSYGMEFNTVLLMLLQNAFGTDFQLTAIPGFDRIGEYLTAVTTPSGLLYGYGDSAERKGVDLAMLWWFKNFDRPDCFSTRMRQDFDRQMAAEPPKNPRSFGNRLLPLALLALPQQLPDPGSARLPLHFYSGREAAVPFAMHRSDPTGNALAVAIKGGAPDSPHGHMDIGSIILEADGVRWITDSGMENYQNQLRTHPDLWNFGQESGRWQVFRLGPDSHSILRIHQARQRVNGYAPIYRSTPDATELDLSPTYAGSAERVTRTVKLDRKARQVELSDRLVGLKPGSVVTFQFATRSDVETNAGNTIILRDGTKKLTLTFDAGPLPVRWEVTPTAELMAKSDTPIPNGKMLRVQLTAPADGQLTTVLRALPRTPEK